MKYTKWTCWTSPSGSHIWYKDTHIADTDGDDAIANAHLIAAAVNGCISVNPENPQAVAESIEDMYSTLKLLVERMSSGKLGSEYGIALELPRGWAERALAKAGRKA